jgi:catechol 2,3-dioxygenase-like lactoylglutathione lyase family enzyme
VADALDARLDHVAIAVADVDAALAHWRDTVGGGMVAGESYDAFTWVQLRMAGGGKLELLGPPRDGGGFVPRFLERFGPTIHHVTLMVDDLPAACAIVRAAGYAVVDVEDTAQWWREGFLRPSQVGGLIVQLAWAGEDDAALAARLGLTTAPPRPSAPRLLGPTLRHPDLDTAAQLWTVLGADVERAGPRLVCRWPDSPLDVAVEAGAPAGPVALRLAGAVPSAPAALGSPPLDVR